MHRIAATPGGWQPHNDGVIFVEQTRAPLVFLTAADTDIQTVAALIPRLPSGFPGLRIVNLLQLQQQLSIDAYADSILSQAEVIILRLLGGRSYWPYGLEVLKETVEFSGAALLVLPGDDRPDLDLISHSTVTLGAVNQLWRYFIEGGIDNFLHGFLFVADVCLHTSYHPPEPEVVPRVGFYTWKNKEEVDNYPQVGLLFYRSHYLAGNIKPIDALCLGLLLRELTPVPIFVSSLRDGEVQEALLTCFQDNPVQLLLNTTSFAIAQDGGFWQELNVPVLQVIFSGGTEKQWEESFQGLSPRDVAMNVALPEMDGRIITRAVSFKSVATWNESLETEVVVYEPKSDRLEFVCDLANNWVQLKQTPPQEKKIALILANYPNKDGRIANGVGLDTPASCLALLNALQAAGYTVENIPATTEELIKVLTAGVTNELAGQELRLRRESLTKEEYGQYFNSLPEKVKEEMRERWGSWAENMPIPGIKLGNIFLGIQPARGYDLDPSLNYHAPDLEPTHNYLAFYYWLRSVFGAQAIIHLGKHGNLEWLPGKSLALSACCYPEVALGALPHFYPFIVNDPGEGSQAKRRGGAVILDHLTPPLTRAQLYGPLTQLEMLIDEYYEAQCLDPSRLKIIGARLEKLVEELHLDVELGIEKLESPCEFLTLVDGYLCELKEAQIRDGLHIFGQCPEGRQLRDLIVAIARSPSWHRLGLTQAIATDWGLDFDPLTVKPGDNFSHSHPKFKKCRNFGDAIEVLEEVAAQLVEEIINNDESQPSTMFMNERALKRNYQPLTINQKEWIEKELLLKLRQTPREIENLLIGLAGEYVPSGPAGAPTRGRPDVLPTGRNFYSVDIRAIPTETAWDLGRKAAEAVIERYTQENGEYPKTLAISIWGTSTMRTGGEDVAQVLALLGVVPIWDGVSRRVIDFEILTPSALGRPRVDVTVRLSGFFRDSFPNLLDLLYHALNAIGKRFEEKDLNPLATQVHKERELWEKQGLSEAQASQLAGYRIFSAKPGAYGAGLQGLIEGQNWKDEQDLARAYVNWSSYAYTVSSQKDGGIKAVAAPEAFGERLKQLQIVLHNQDNREHDLLDSDDYYQFQGGLTVAVRAATGKNPQVYFGDNSIPTNPRVRLLKEEIGRVYRSRVVNPKWIAGVMNHGYKGAFEMAATVDYLFAYDATASCVEDYMYQGVTEAYLLDEQVQRFIQEKNPWALRDMAERLLEAAQRGLWQFPSQEILEKLRNIVHQAEGVIEGLIVDS
ncbi:MAG: cobaltochelatase subunit CobN [Gomphosphaeria aponina SAG 52.96 = DSM 107014]|uniref:Cobaltochelatase subunit CobN n=1 Tax=Gomphosphaeria aponina SAG 52.96 = DSM 107014 TaxID=1521640 RepID=A0A941JN38_9CHRO|nr:cobaltochelatase subunit CobN [Gomphosphaeria aponina SAG 52.96 = DSM 107014]